ncbi:ATP-binding cassette domain-containing protein [Streptococcus pluranimalium]|uniref:ATP-binding cassette domain-containing protein n=1 Tax=Streptococcus pluranimalium TaxID=82348 RepID=UPI003F68073E
MKALVSVSDISKTIKGKQVLDAISFEITRGECVALIGQNGAGKSSLLKCIISDWNVNKGSIVIQQLSPTNGQLKGKIAVLAQENTIPINLKVKELILFVTMYLLFLTNSLLIPELKPCRKPKKKDGLIN